jgi:hypothetical protein
MKTGIGVGESDHLPVLDLDVQVVAVAEMLDPRDLPSCRAIEALGDPEVLRA